VLNKPLSKRQAMTASGRSQQAGVGQKQPVAIVSFSSLYQPVEQKCMAVPTQSGAIHSLQTPDLANS